MDIKLEYKIVLGNLKVCDFTEIVIKTPSFSFKRVPITKVIDTTAYVDDMNKFQLLAETEISYIAEPKSEDSDNIYYVLTLFIFGFGIKITRQRGY